MWLSSGIQHSNCLLVMIEKRRKIRDEKGAFSDVLTDLPKVFDCIPHQLLMAKLSGYWFWREISSFYFRVPQNPKTENKNWSTFCEYLNILFGVSRSSILRPLLFLIFIADLFYLNYYLYFASYADDITPYICEQDFSSIINVLESNANTLFNWFWQNGLISNSDKSHFLISPYKEGLLKIHDTIITSSSSEELMGVLIDTCFLWSSYKTLL